MGKAKKKNNKTKKRSAKDIKINTELYDKTIDSLQKLYADGRKAWTAPDEEKFEGIKTTAKGISASTYGEITMKGVSTILAKFREEFQNPNAVFYDLGCGLGRMVGQIALLSDVKRSVGIELCPNRIAAARKLASTIEFPAAQPEFIEGNFLEQDYSDATIVYIDNTMYERDVTEKLLKMLPPECIFIFQQGWMPYGLPNFECETTYNKTYDSSKEGQDRLFVYLAQRAAWQPAKGFKY